jgi:hypothetical protein
VPFSGDINRRTTHVEAGIKGSQDAGSIPAASNDWTCDKCHKSFFCCDLRDLSLTELVSQLSIHRRLV